MVSTTDGNVESARRWRWLGRGTVPACIAVVLAAQGAQAASAVAASEDRAFGYAFNVKGEAEAQALALQSCGRRTRSPCRIIVSCAGPGYGAISFRRHPPGKVEALGASCGAPSVEEAYRIAIDGCNAEAKTGRCGVPRTAWRDTEDTP